MTHQNPPDDISRFAPPGQQTPSGQNPGRQQSAAPTPARPEAQAAPAQQPTVPEPAEQLTTPAAPAWQAPVPPPPLPPEVTAQQHPAWQHSGGSSQWLPVEGREHAPIARTNAQKYQIPRTLGAVFCICVAVGLLLAGALSRGVLVVLENEDHFAAVMDETYEDVTQADVLTNFVVDQMWMQIDQDEVIAQIGEYVREAAISGEELPPLLAGLDQAQVSDQQIKQFVDNLVVMNVRGVLTSDDARAVWDQATRDLHSELTDRLNGKSSNNHDLYLNLTPLVQLWAAHPSGIESIDSAVASLDLNSRILYSGEAGDVKFNYQIFRWCADVSLPVGIFLLVAALILSWHRVRLAIVVGGISLLVYFMRGVFGQQQSDVLEGMLNFNNGYFAPGTSTDISAVVATIFARHAGDHSVTYLRWSVAFVVVAALVVVALLVQRRVRARRSAPSQG